MKAVWLYLPFFLVHGNELTREKTKTTKNKKEVGSCGKRRKEPSPRARPPLSSGRRQAAANLWGVHVSIPHVLQNGGQETAGFFCLAGEQRKPSCAGVGVLKVKFLTPPGDGRVRGAGPVFAPNAAVHGVIRQDGAAASRKFASKKCSPSREGGGAGRSVATASPPSPSLPLLRFASCNVARAAEW